MCVSARMPSPDTTSFIDVEEEAVYHTAGATTSTNCSTNTTHTYLRATHACSAQV